MDSWQSNSLGVSTSDLYLNTESVQEPFFNSTQMRFTFFNFRFGNSTRQRSKRGNNYINSQVNQTPLLEKENEFLRKENARLRNILKNIVSEVLK